MNYKVNDKPEHEENGGEGSSKLPSLHRNT